MLKNITPYAVKPLHVAVLLALCSQTAMAIDTHNEDTNEQDKVAQSDQNLGSTLVTADAGLDQINNTATKMNVSLRNTGRSITVLDEHALREINATDLEQTLDYVPGFSANSGNEGSLTVRGMKTDYKNILIDGFRSLEGTTDGDGGRSGSVLPSTYNLESASFLRGQDGLLYGSGMGGGMINLTTKKPQEEASTSIGVQGSSYLANDVGYFDRNRLSLTLDSTGPLNDNLLYRVITSYTPSGEYFQDGVSIDETLVDLSVTFLLNDNTKLTPRIEYTQRNLTGISTASSALDQSSLDSSTPYGTPNDRSVYLGSSEDYKDNTALTVDLTLAHNFNPLWELNSRLRYSENEAEQLSLEVVDDKLSDQGLLARRWESYENNDTYKMFDIGVQGKFSTGSLEHHLLVGGSYRDFSTEYGGKSQSRKSKADNDIDPLDTTNQNVGPIPANVLNFMLSPKGTEDTNIYLKDRISIGDLTLTPGISYVKQKQTRSRTSSLSYTNVYTDTSDKILWDLGAIYALNNNINIFTTYSTAYDPINVRHIAQYGYEKNGKGTDDYLPIEGNNYEVGIKGNFFDNHLTPSVTLFQQDRENKTTFICTPPDYDCLLIQTKGKNFTSKGLEADVAFRVNSQWSGLFSYAYTDASYLVDDSEGNKKGVQADNTPMHSATLWNRYRLSGRLNGFKLALGIRYESERRFKENIVASYVEADAGIYYDNADWEASLLLKNAFDKSRAKTGSENGLITPNEPRALTFNIKRHF
ncbi:TonB-dependent siderophore receptor [Moritella sp. 28]|uniref:TonB-dependent siderophore receptor n=1 Tax=Moritella sp. 28 TaxID=2746232 RepID=UPI001BABA6DF|nr:TonB-dependent receptor [Moritella sp. 28]QUM84076.1 TonB-dependent receptor [Moritella sp. 28]